MNGLKIMFFHSKKSSHYRISADFGYVYLCNLSKCWCYSRLYTFFSTLGPYFNYFSPSTEEIMAEKRQVLATLPPVLTFSLKRFEGAYGKIGTHVDLPLVLDMGPFTCPANEVGGTQRFFRFFQSKIFLIFF